MSRRRRKATGLVEFGPFDRTGSPVMPTSLVGVAPDGRMYGEDGSIWAYFSVPLGPTFDAKNLRARLEVSTPFIGALGELAAGAGIVLSKRRVFQKHNYRAFHVLGVNIDAAFTPPGDHPLREMLSREFCDGRDVVIRRCVVLGVRLRRSVVSSSMATMVDRMAASFQSGRGALAATDEDFEHVRAIMARWGLSTPTRQDRSLVRAWWNAGRSPDTPYMVEPERLHILRSAEAARKAHDLYEAGVPLERWPTIPGHSVLTFASVTEFEVPDVDVLDPRASWLTPLINAGAVCVSVNGLLEPGYMTAREIERNKNRYESDIRDGGRYGKDATPEQVDKLRALTRVREVYAGGSTAPPSIIDASVVVAFEGDGKDLARTQFPGVQVAVLGNRQVGAMAETWLAPTSRSNPMLHDMPIDLLAYSGLCSLSVVGDRPAGSALVGYTEMDRQPVWANVAAASSQADLPPLYGVFGESGSGKSLLMLWLCLQHAALGHRTVYIDPKEGSDFSRVVERYGGQTVCLSDVIGSRGILDPLNLTDTPDDGLALAIAMLAYIAPWGSRTRDMELDLTVALREGVNRGARSILSALRRARQAGVAEAGPEMIDTLEKYARSVPFASALIGDADDGPRLSFTGRFTMVRLGDMALNINSAADDDLATRTTMSLVRMLVRGSTIAVRGEDGCVALDEAWIFFRASEAELDSLARLARSQRVAVYMGSQKVADALDADGEVKVPFSSGFILGMRKNEEVAAACKLLRIEPTADRRERITAPPTIETTSGQRLPNFASLRALIRRDVHTGEFQEVVRGAVALFADVADRVVATEVRLPDEYLRLASTNPADRARAGEAVD